MDTTIDKIENSEALIKIRVKEDDYQPGVTRKIKDFCKKASIKGFRPGKVPAGLVKQMYGTSFLVEEVNHKVSHELNHVLRDNGMQFLGEPLPSAKQETIDWETQKEFEFLFDIGYTDEFELKVDNKLKIDYNRIKVDKKVLDETIENIRKQSGELSNPEEVSQGDTIYGPVNSADGTIQQEVSIDLDEFTDSFRKKLTGLKTEAEIELDAVKSFKDKEYFGRISRLKEEELKSVKNKLTMTIKGINHVVPAELNQELFDRTFGENVVKSVEEFTEKVKETISKNYENESLQYFNYKVRETLVEKTKINLPDAFLKRWLLETNENITEDILVKEYDQYAKELKWSLIRGKIAKDNEIKAEHEEVISEAKAMILMQFGGAGLAEQLGPQLDQFADNYLKGENGENYMKVYNQVQNQKVYTFIKENIAVKEKEVSLDDFRKLS
ncbi:MAG: trigger factor [Cyclobacteriaceae bacterium]|nr:trigger factor [Cyclobacteriaceae bacterium]